jgi:protein SCO1/2
MEQNRRPSLASGSLALVDQEGASVKLSDFAGMPIVLAFFYTQCPNQLKCVSTVHRLGELEAKCAKQTMAGKVAIIGMTYDPDFDGPSVLKQYGQLHGIRFNSHVRLVKAAGGARLTLPAPFQLRVSYGAGSVNQHGVQVFVFDKRGRVAAALDNDVWSAATVADCISRLLAE